MRIHRWLTLAVLSAGVSLGLSSSAIAQGTTTGAVTGAVTNERNALLEGAIVQVLNVTNGSRSSQVTRSNGRFFIQNLEVGRYSITVRMIGYAPETKNDIVVSLTQATPIDFVLKEQVVRLSTVLTEVAATTADFAATRQGAQTIITDTLVRRLPTLNRDVSDLIRNSPQVNVAQDGRISAAGQNNRFNNIQIDGVSLANRFGLGASPTVGAQVNGRALPLDAIKEFQVLISPYDVRQGNFTGALVNAVTQSGTNEFKGSAFVYYRDQQLGRDTAFLRTAPFVRRQLGFSLGGPIIKNRLRFFATVETSDNRAPSTGPFYDPASPTGLANSNAPSARITAAQIDSFTTRLTSVGIDAGDAFLTSNENPLLNTFARLDFQISENTRLVVRNIYNDQSAFDFSRSLGTFNFNDWTAGVVYKQPLGRRSDRALEQRAAEGLSMESARLAQLEHEILHQLDAAYKNLQAAESLLDLHRRRREAAAVQLDARRELYRENRAALRDQLDAEARYASAMLDEALAKVAYRRAVTDWNFARGAMTGDAVLVRQ